MIDFLQKDQISIGTNAGNKTELLQEIAQKASKAAQCQGLSSDVIYKALLAREEITSTGLAQGIAIPHTSFEELDQFLVGLIVLPQGFEFNSLDQKPSNLVFYIIGPKKDRNTHIKILSQISLLAKDPQTIESVLLAKSTMDVFLILTSDKAKETQQQISDKCQLQIHIQNENFFYEVLEVLSSEIVGQISILDSASAGSFLHKLPLFSSFWTESEERFSKIVLCLVDKALVNELIRRINMVKPGEESGILILVNELLYADGSIDY
jgi:mannitol/fructose-specific phosphotransferase system IIA component (Ntr-type)